MSDEKLAERRATPDQVEAWVRASCALQGVAVKVADADVLGRVVALLGHSGKERPSAPQRGRARPAASSEPPRRLDAVRVETLRSPDAGPHRGVVEDGVNNGNSSTKSKRFPLRTQGDPTV